MKYVGELAITDDAYDFLQQAKVAGRRVIQVQIDGGRDCSNCGDTHYLYFSAVTGGPYKTPPQHGICAWMGDAWYSVVTVSFPCPVCNADSTARLEYLWTQCGLRDPSERHWHLDYIAHMPGKEVALAEAHALLEQTPSPAGWLFLHGSYGVGKTGVLKALVAAFIRAGVSARYVVAGDILDEIRATFDRDSRESVESVKARYDRFKFLAIDEVDRHGGTDWALNTFMALIDARYSLRHMTATAMASNLSPEDLTPRLGYLTDRLRDGKRVAMGGESLRGRVQAALPDTPPWEDA